MSEDLEPADEAATPLAEVLGEEAALEAVAAPAETPEPAPEPVPAAGVVEPFWYRKTLKEQDKRNKDLQREIEQLRAQRAPVEPHELPDPGQDPQGYRSAIMSETQAATLNTKLDTSELLARDKHGDQAVDEMMDWLGTRQDIAQWAMRQRHPYQAALDQFRREKLASEIGDDPKAYEQRLREKILAEMQEQAGAMPTNPMTRPTIPAPASQVRSATPRQGATGPTPLRDILPHKFGA